MCAESWAFGEAAQRPFYSLSSQPFMSSIQLHDKTFAPEISSEEIQRRISDLATLITEDVKGERPLFIGVLNGCFRFAADLLTNFEPVCDISFVKVASYSGTQSTGDVKQLIGLEYSVKDRVVIIIEDIVDTGTTIENIVETLSAQGPKELRIATLLYKPGAYQKDIPIDYSAFEVPNDFLVGYGLDYDGLGRNLNSIYKVIPSHLVWFTSLLVTSSVATLRARPTSASWPRVIWTKENWFQIKWPSRC